MASPLTPRRLEHSTLSRFRRRMALEAVKAGIDPEEYAEAMVARWGEKILAATSCS